MLDVVCFKWKPAWAHYRSTYTGEHVNVLFDMVRRHYQKPFRFSCVTDDPSGIDGRVRIIPLWPDHSDMVSPHGMQNPSCYRRLRLFARDAAEIIGPRFVWMDLDMVVCRDLAPIFDRREDVVLWQGSAGRNPYNGAMLLLRAGARPKVWEEFDPQRSPIEARRAGFMGSDQAWLCHALGPNEARFTMAEGCYSWRLHLRFNRGKLPADARIVNFAGSSGDPWQKPIQSSAPWIRDHYRRGEDASGTARPALDMAAGD